jgi:transposase-like protein
MAEAERDRFAHDWDHKYPMISRSWHKNWPELITFLDYPPEIHPGFLNAQTITSPSHPQAILILYSLW